MHRVQLVRNINAIDGKPELNGQVWETVRRKDRTTVVQWIDDQMSYKRAVVVLIRQETASRPWVIYEIEKAWAAMKPILGVRIHGLSSMGVLDGPGPDPFAEADGDSGVPIFDPTVHDWRGSIDSKATYNNLVGRLPGWADGGKGSDSVTDPECPFCDIVRREEDAREVYRDEHVVAFFPMEPATLGHTLIVPREHIPNIWSLDDDTAGHLARVTVRLSAAVREALSPEGLNVIQSNGAAATQTVFHLHVHVVPRWEGDG